MRKPLVAIAVLLVAAGCSTIHRLDSTKYEVIPVPQGIQDPAKLQDVARRLTNGLPVIFKVTGGAQLPFKLRMDLPMGSLDKTESLFVFNRDTYFLFSPKGFRLSPDGQRWASGTSPKAMSRLFGFKHGEFSFGFNSGTNERPSMNVDVKVK